MTPRPLAVLAAAVLALAAAGCGTESDGGAPPDQPAASEPSGFPDAAGRTLEELQKLAPEGPVMSPTFSIVNPREQTRIAFGLFDKSRRQLPGAEVALYVADRTGRAVDGPIPVRYESLETKPAFRSQTTANDPDAAKGVYVADVRFPSKGSYVAMAIARLDGRLVHAGPIELPVGKAKAQPPKVGEKAIRVHTPTAADVGGDLSKISTRVPPAADLHEDDLADVLGKKPVVITFSTPQLCQVRVCGPVVDVVEQVRAETKADAAFIHMEIYEDNDANKGARPQVTAWRLPSEPWTFVIDRKGVVRERFEGAHSVGELQRAVARVTGG